ncbi:MAG: hypothetical protein II712_03905 [Erysipelotrichaceae bacterium]|nr:hypothetical protein [Erysipelotrichaceae bacterium]
MKGLNKKTYIVIATAVVALCLGVFGIMKHNAKTEALETLTMEFNTEENEDGVIQLEYGLSTLNPMDYVNDHTGDITVSPEEIDLSVPGEKEIVYTLSTKDKMGGNVRKKYVKKIVVADTKAPDITFKKETVTAYLNGTVSDNSLAVKDAVDGDLELVETEPEPIAKIGNIYEKGWYMITGEVDVATEGEYEVKIIACDRNGNRSERSYTVVVKKEQYTYRAYWYDDYYGKLSSISAKSAVSEVNDLIKALNSGKGSNYGVVKAVNRKRNSYSSLEQIVNDGLYFVVTGGRTAQYIYVYNSAGKVVKKFQYMKPQ